MSNKKQTAVEWLAEQIRFHISNSDKLEPLITQAKEMGKEQHEKFNKFLDVEKELGIADLKTIERIKWYYNTYFNETYGGNNE